MQPKDREFWNENFWKEIKKYQVNIDKVTHIQTGFAYNEIFISKLYVTCFSCIRL